MEVDGDGWRLRETERDIRVLSWEMEGDQRTVLGWFARSVFSASSYDTMSGSDQLLSSNGMYSMNRTSMLRSRDSSAKAFSSCMCHVLHVSQLLVAQAIFSTRVVCDWQVIGRCLAGVWQAIGRRLAGDEPSPDQWFSS